MTNANLEKTILKQIKEKGLKPKPKSFFFFRNLAFWFLTGLFIFVGGFVFSILLYRMSDNISILEYVIADFFGNSFDILRLIPYFWLGMLAIFLGLSFFIFKRTDLAYRYDTSSIVFFMLTAIMIFGTAMFYIGISRKADLFTQRYLYFYDNYQKIQEIKKNIFIKKLSELGITENILKENPELEKLVYKKFAKNVLGKTYLYSSKEECQKKEIKCSSNDIFFEDEDGCGCREVYIKINQ